MKAKAHNIDSPIPRFEDDRAGSMVPGASRLKREEGQVTGASRIGLVLIGLGAACSGERYLDRPDARGAATLVYFVHDERRIERAIVVEPQAGYYPAQLQLAAERPSEEVITVAAYARPPEELGLRPGRLTEALAGKLLPAPDYLLQTGPQDDSWRPLKEVPTPVAGFRTPLSPSPRCHDLLPHPLSIPFQTPGTIDFDGVEAVTLTATSAFIHAHARLQAEVSTALSYRHLDPFEDSRSNCIFSPARSGTTALGACGWLFRFHVEGSRLVRTSWGDSYPFVLADEAGELAATGFDFVERMTLAREPLGHLSPHVPWPKDATFRQIAYFAQEIFAIDDEALLRVTATGTAAEIVGEPRISAIGVANHAIYAGGHSGSIVRRSPAGTWHPLPPPATAVAPPGGFIPLSAVQAILPIPGGIFAVWADGRGAEYFEDLGWCPSEEVTRGPLDAAVQLGTGYLLVTARPSSLAIYWVDLGLIPK